MRRKCKSELLFKFNNIKSSMEELQFMFIYIVILWVVNVLFTIVEEIIEVSRIQR